VWDGYMKMRRVKSSRGGGYSDRGRGEAIISAGDVAHGVDGGVVADHIIR